MAAPAVPKLIEAALTDPDNSVRASAIGALGDLSPASASAATDLVPNALDPEDSPWVRHVAALRSATWSDFRAATLTEFSKKLNARMRRFALLLWIPRVTSKTAFDLYCRKLSG